LKFSELERLLKKNGFKLEKKNGSKRFYHKPGYDKVIQIDYHASKEVPTGTCLATLKAAGIRQ
jgi:predicted RNA binding protein YcfA (HicA-like mRNA interferase family)